MRVSFARTRIDGWLWLSILLAAAGAARTTRVALSESDATKTRKRDDS